MFAFAAFVSFLGRLFNGVGLIKPVSSNIRPSVRASASDARRYAVWPCRGRQGHEPL